MHYDFRRMILITTKTSKATTASAGPYRLSEHRTHRAEHIKGAFTSASLGLGLARRCHGWRCHGGGVVGGVADGAGVLTSALAVTAAASSSAGTASSSIVCSVSDSSP